MLQLFDFTLIMWYDIVITYNITNREDRLMSAKKRIYQKNLTKSPTVQSRCRKSVNRSQAGSSNGCALR